MQVIEIYRKFFEEKNIDKIDYPDDELLSCTKMGLSHCYGMIDKMEKFIHEGRIEKAFRWLGFIQGFLWSNRIYTLTNFMDHNQPTDKLGDTDEHR